MGSPRLTVYVQPEGFGMRQDFDVVDEGSSLCFVMPQGQFLVEVSIKPAAEAYEVHEEAHKG